MRRVADDDPRWRQSEFGYGCNAAERMDPPPRSLARRSVSLLHGRGPLDPTDYKRVARAPAHTRQAPLGSSVEPYPIVTACRRPHVLDRRCARRLWHLAVGAEESLWRGRTKERGPRKPRRKERSCC